MSHARIGRMSARQKAFTRRVIQTAMHLATVASLDPRLGRPFQREWKKGAVGRREAPANPKVSK